MALIRVLDPFPWPRSAATRLSLEELVTGGQLTPAGDDPHPAWMVPPVSDRELSPPPGYVVSFILLHERDFNASASRFMRGLCHHYGVELHYFPPMPSRRRLASLPTPDFPKKTKCYLYVCQDLVSHIVTS
jgi:hypothetical protein